MASPSGGNWGPQNYLFSSEHGFSGLYGYRCFFLRNTNLANLTNVDEGGPPWCSWVIRLVRGKKYLGAAELFVFW